MKNGNAHLLNRKRVKEVALNLARERWGEFQYGQRVSGRFLDRVEANLLDWLKKEIRLQPSKGKTIY